LTFIHAPALIKPLSVVASIAAVVLAIAVLARDRSPNRTDRAFAGLMLTALVASPLGWFYYLPLAMGPLYALWRSRRERTSPSRDVAITCALPGLLSPFVFSLIGADQGWGAFTFASCYAYSTIAIWAAILFDARAVTRISGTVRAA
jgi:hypothetical protein